MSDWSLEIEGKQKILDPSPEQINEAIRSITPSDDSFVILQKGADGLTYMQAFLDDDSSWTLEYQDGHLDKHFQASTKLSAEGAIGLFLDFGKGDERWRTSVNWDKLKL
jgi:hypothetical protein